MKQLVLLLTGIVLISRVATAQMPVLWAPASNDGKDNAGTIVKVNANGSDFTTVISLNDTDGNLPAGTMVLAPNNTLYGMAFEGGTYNNGVIFSVNPTTGVYTDLYNIDTLGEAWVNLNMVQVNDSTLYGLIYEGGANNNGTLFSFNTNSNTFTKQYYFNVATGERPREIMLAGNKKLYGTTDTGGLYGRGTLFSYSPATNVYTDVHDFDTSVAGATGSMVHASDSSIYGLVEGATTAGAIYSFKPSTGNYGVVFSFNGTNGQPSWDNGMTTYGGTNSEGVIFSFDFTDSTYSDLVNFESLTIGEYPICGLTAATDGNLYGVLTGGGSHGYGTIISFDPNDTVAKDIYNLTTAGGCAPYSGVTQVGVTTGINRLTVNNSKMSVFPNPASSELFLKFSQGFVPNTITVYNAIGQQITLPFNAALNKSLNIENLPSGLYFIKATDDETVLSDVFIKE